MNRSTTVNLAQLEDHLRTAARSYQQTASVLNLSAEGAALAANLHKKATQCHQIADAIRNAASIGFAGADIEILHT